MNYNQLGLKIGFEFHQQLDTNNKLFCNCPNKVKDKEKNYSFKRYLHPTKSELGEIDRAALEEARLQKQYIYHGYDENTCLVEMDEEPPHPLNQEALDIGIETSLLLDAEIVDLVQVMRKIVIDGSNTAGFQRTALIATDGEINTESGKIGIDGISIEEESAQKISGDLGEEKIKYDLQRLGIPLIEIGSDPDIQSPKQAREFAEKMGMILRSTRKVKRGIGTIRQDLNISIEKGSRIELKGVQELDLIEDYIEQEVKRQTSLIEIKKELKKRNIEDIPKEIHEVTEIFEETESTIIQKAIKNGEALALNLPGFKDLVGKEIQTERRLGTEFSDRAKKAAGVGGIFHTDELPKYGITKQEVEKLRKELDAEEKDCVILVAAQEQKAKEALETVYNRAKQCLKDIPKETRRPLDNGTSEYMRPLPGSARMYPETDIPPVEIKEKRIEEIKKELPELIEEKIERYRKELGLDGGKAKQIAKSTKVDVFEKIIEKTEIKPTIIYKTLIGHLNELEEEIDAEKVTENHLINLFISLDKGEFSKENIPDLLKLINKEPKKDIKQLIKENDLAKVGKEEIREVVEKVVEEKEEIISERKMGAMGPLMGVIMDKLNRRADGDTVSEYLKEAILERIE